MKYSNVKLLSIMTSILLIATFVPSAAFGQTKPLTHAADLFPPGPISPGTVVQFQSVNTPAGGSTTADIRITKILMVYSPTGAFLVPSIPTDDPTVPPGAPICDEVVPTVGSGEMIWELWHSSGVPVTAEHVDIDNPSVLHFDSIDADPTDPDVVPPLWIENLAAVPGDGFGSGTPATTGTTAFSTISPSLGPGEFYYWQKISSTGTPIPGADTTGMEGVYIGLICAFIDANNNDDWGGFGASGEETNVIAASISVFAMVGGESIPLNTMALLIAGAQTNALWILPIFGLVGTIIAIRKLEA